MLPPSPFFRSLFLSTYCHFPVLHTSQRVPEVQYENEVMNGGGPQYVQTKRLDNAVQEYFHPGGLVNMEILK